MPDWTLKLRSKAFFKPVVHSKANLSEVLVAGFVPKLLLIWKLLHCYLELDVNKCCRPGMSMTGKIPLRQAYCCV